MTRQQILDEYGEWVFGYLPPSSTDLWTDKEIQAALAALAADIDDAIAPQQDRW